MGYRTVHIQGGAGFSYARHASKDMPNGRCVHLVEHFPSPLDPAGQLAASYSVWLGQVASTGDHPCPFEVPAGASAEAWAPDAETDWFADFGEAADGAEAYALALPAV